MRLNPDSKLDFAKFAAIWTTFKQFRMSTRTAENTTCLSFLILAIKKALDITESKAILLALIDKGADGPYVRSLADCH